MQGAAWLALLMPTREVRLLAADWNGWLAHWMAAWETVVHSSMWDAYWLTLLSRLAKHDTRGDSTTSPSFASLESILWNALTLPRMMSVGGPWKGPLKTFLPVLAPLQTFLISKIHVISHPCRIGADTASTSALLCCSDY